MIKDVILIAISIVAIAIVIYKISTNDKQQNREEKLKAEIVREVGIKIADVDRSVEFCVDRLWDHIDELDKKARDEKAVRTVEDNPLYEFVLIKRYGQRPEIWHNGKSLKYNGKAEIHCEAAEMRVKLEY